MEQETQEEEKYCVIDIIVPLISYVIAFICMYQKRLFYDDKACHAALVCNNVSYDVWSVSNKDVSTEASKG